MASFTMNDLADRIATACPGAQLLRCGSWSDKTTWDVKYPAAATDEQRAAAQAVIDAAPAPLVMGHRYVSKRTIRLRLRAAGLEAAADSALAADPAKLRDWQEAQDIDPEDADVIAMLTAIGADINEILK